ncbi:MAG: hypothetical protein ACYC4S_11705 [Rhodoferax sp.]
MFITHLPHKSPMSGLFGDSSKSHWLAVELAMQLPWFLVSYREFESNSVDASSVGRTIMVHTVEALEQLVQESDGGLFKFDSVYIITPGHVNGTDQWQMDLLDCIRTADEPEAPGQVVDVFETRGGARYACSMLETSIEDLRIGAVRFQSP